MKSLEFMYWLQGYFELSAVSELNLEQTTIIKNHLKMVDITDQNKLSPFCSWLNGFLEHIGENYPNSEQTLKIKNKLNNVFDHVIPSYTTPKDTYHKSGMQLNPSTTSELIRC